MLVQQYLENSAEKKSDKTALVCDTVRLSYREIEEKANRAARGLIRIGLERNDRVVINLPNTPECVISIFAVLKAMGIFVILNPSTKKDKLMYIMNNCRASILITADGNSLVAKEIDQKVPSLKRTIICSRSESFVDGSEKNNSFITFDELIEGESSEKPNSHTIDQDIACLIYTSGSTGEPKGVMSGHNNINFASNSIITYLEHKPQDSVLNVLPFSFDYGLYQLLMTFRFGGTLVLEKSFAYPAQVLKRIEKEKVTCFPCVPTMLSIILHMCLESFNLKSLRLITNTAAALPQKYISVIREKYPWIQIYSMYGLTECKRTLFLPPEMLTTKPGSVGFAIPGTEVWLEDGEGNRIGSNEVGELVIRGSHVMRGYWEDSETTRKVFRAGPTPGERILYSGDLFKMDEDGCYYFISRKDDIIKSRGEKVSPKEVENIIYKLEGVVEAAVVGVPDPILGQAIKAFIVSKDPGVNEQSVKRHCSAYLEDFMVPSHVEFREELPKTGSGKIKVKELN